MKFPALKVFIGCCVLPLSSLSTYAAQDSLDPAENAALQYWQAFDSRKYLEDHEFDQPVYEIIDRAREGHFGDDTEKLFKEAGPVFRYLKQGTEMPYCEWGTYFAGNPRHLSHCKSLGQFISAGFRYRMHRGEQTAAIETLVDGLKFSDHISNGRFVIEEIIRIADQAILIQAASEGLTDLNDESLRELRRVAEDTLTLEPKPGDVFLADWNLMLTRVRQQLATENGELRESDPLIQEVLNSLPEEAEIQSAEDLVRELDEVEGRVRKLSEILNNTKPEQLDEELESFAASTGLSKDAGNIDSAAVFYGKSHRMAIESALFLAAIDVVLNGPGSLDAREYMPERTIEHVPGYENTFELKADWVFKGEQQTVTLSVGSVPVIHQAAREGNLDLIQYHLEHGTDVNAQDADGWTTLHHAAANGRTEAVQILVEHEAAINRTTSGHGPSGILNSRREVMERYGLKVTPKSPSASLPQGRTALDLAIEKGHEETAELLKSRGAKTVAELQSEYKKKSSGSKDNQSLR